MNMRCILKVMGLVSQTIYFNPKEQTIWFPVQSNPPWVWCPFQSFSTMFLCSIGRILLGCSSTIMDLDDLQIFKMGPLDDPLKLEQKKNVTQQDQMNRVVFPVRWCSYQPGTARCSAHLVLLLFRYTWVIIFQTLSFFMPSWLAISWIVN